MMTRIGVTLLLVAVLGGCDRGGASAPANRSNPLERAAQDRGLVVAEDDRSWAGLYERNHELGRDALCLTGPDGDASRFGITAAFGPGLTCNGRGLTSGLGDALTLRFDGDANCTIRVSVADDIVQFPGALPSACADLCPGGASLAGLEIPRVGWSAADAARMRVTAANGRIDSPCA